eukprot:7673741-Lingulodinium_polyedra.AAC.1
MFVSRNADAGELLRQMNISAAAIKQRPFVAWQQGVRACQPQIQIAGQRGGGHMPRHVLSWD